jgi:hypothetical protein
MSSIRLLQNRTNLESIQSFLPLVCTGSLIQKSREGSLLVFQEIILLEFLIKLHNPSVLHNL